MEEGDIETTKSNVNYAASLMRKGSRNNRGERDCSLRLKYI